MRGKTGLVAILVVLIILIPQSKYIEYVWGKQTLEEENAGALSEKWLLAVANNDAKSSLALAKKLVSIPPSISIPQKHIKLAESEGIQSSFFAASFNFWDFKLWRDAHFFHQLSQKITGRKSNDIKAMFQAVRRRIAPHDGDLSVLRSLWPYWIWQRGYGVCDRQAWVLCELAYQAGWETQVVYLRNPQTKVSPHTICELRKPGGLVWFADPFTNILLPQKSIEDVAADKDLLKTLWPDNPERRPALQDCIFWTPSYPQDYCPRNQKLYNILQQILKDRCPRFGVPPEQRLETYRQIGQRGSRPPRFPMELWSIPFQRLKADIMWHCLKFGYNFLK